MTTIKVNLDSLINLIGNYLIRLRLEPLVLDSPMYNDLKKFTDYLSRYTIDEETVSCDSNFITSKDEYQKISDAIISIPNLSVLAELFSSKDATAPVNREEVTKILREIISNFIVLKNKIRPYYD